MAHNDSRIIQSNPFRFSTLNHSASERTHNRRERERVIHQSRPPKLSHNNLQPKSVHTWPHQLPLIQEYTRSKHLDSATSSYTSRVNSREGEERREICKVVRYRNKRYFDEFSSCPLLGHRLMDRVVPLDGS